jgi:hypothetical protein
MTDKKCKTDQSERPWTREPKEHPLIEFVENHHYGVINERNVPLDVMYAAEKRTRGMSFKWHKSNKVWIFSGRNSTKCSTFEKGPQRDDYLKEIFGPLSWTEFDLHSSVPCVMRLLLTGDWFGTSDTVHIRKDIHRSLGIDENAHGPEVAEVIKTVSMRWNFSTTVRKARANFERAHLWTKKDSWSGVDLKGIYSDLAFLRGWASYHSWLSGIAMKSEADLDLLEKWSRNNALLKYSVFWWESRIGNEATRSLIKNGFIVAQNYDCIYSNAPVCVIKAAFDDAASLVRNEYLSEKQSNLYTDPDFMVSGIFVSLPKDPMSAFLLKNGRIPEQDDDDDECLDWSFDVDVAVSPVAGSVVFPFSAPSVAAASRLAQYSAASSSHTENAMENNTTHNIDNQPQTTSSDRLTRTGLSEYEDFLRSYRGMLDRSKRSRNTPGRPKGSPRVGGRPKGSTRVGGTKPGSPHRGSTGSVAGSHEKELATLRLRLTNTRKALLKKPGDAVKLAQHKSLLEAIDEHIKKFGDNRHH